MYNRFLHEREEHKLIGIVAKSKSEQKYKTEHKSKGCSIMQRIWQSWMRSTKKG